MKSDLKAESRKDVFQEGTSIPGQWKLVGFRSLCAQSINLFVLLVHLCFIALEECVYVCEEEGGGGTRPHRFHTRTPGNINFCLVFSILILCVWKYD